ncbi:MAG: hypothetical protein U1E49_02445 [Hyphomicrobiaceae bacterium]
MGRAARHGRSLRGDIDEYRRELLDERSGRNRGKQRAAPAPASPAAKADQRRDEAQRRAGLSPLKKAVEAAEKKIAKLDAEIAGLDKLLADPALYTREPERAKTITRDRGQLLKTREVAEAAWLEASEAYEAATGT